MTLNIFSDISNIANAIFFIILKAPNPIGQSAYLDNRFLKPLIYPLKKNIDVSKRIKPLWSYLGSYVRFF